MIYHVINPYIACIPIRNIPRDYNKSQLYHAFLTFMYLPQVHVAFFTLSIGAYPEFFESAWLLVLRHVEWLL